MFAFELLQTVSSNRQLHYRRVILNCTGTQALKPLVVDGIGHKRAQLLPHYNVL